jgi:multiple sugar transport system permease protein
MATTSAGHVSRTRTGTHGRSVARGTLRDYSRLTPYLFLAPYLVLFLVFVLAPAVGAIWMSVHDYDQLLGAGSFVGARNFTDLFSSSSATGAFFWQSMLATGKFVVFSVPLLVVLPLLLALVLNKKFPGRTFFRAVFFAPYVLGVAVTGILWRFMLDPGIGIVNFYLTKFGVDTPPAWTNDLPWAWIGLVAMTVWWTIGLNTVIYLAGLQDIPQVLYDASKTDGAGRWQVFRTVTLPGLRPVLVFIVTITILSSANMFGQSYLTTQGAPGVETRTAIMYIAQVGFQTFHMGAAAAMSLVLAIFLAVIGVANFVFFRERD